MNDDELGTRLEEAFRAHAKDMYRGVGLAAEARRRVRRRRTVLTTAAAVALVIGIGSAWGSAVGFRTGGNETASDSAGAGKAAPEMPGRDAKGSAEQDSGWRWESYGGVQVEVPSSWGYGVTDAPWCAQDRLRAGEPGEVGRPGPFGYVRCKDPAPSTALRQHVWFSPAGSARPSSNEQLGAGWVRDVMIVGKVKVEVQTHADEEVRSRILRSIRYDATDVYGCPATHPAAVPAFTRPSDGLDWSAPGVTGVSICSYKLNAEGGMSPLYASAREDAAGAVRLLDTIRAAPVGGGPDDPNGDPAKLGGDLTVLRFSTPDGIHEVYVRYSGARHNGFDNGIQVRRLTRPALSFLTGPLRVRTAPKATVGLLPRE